LDNYATALIYLSAEQKADMQARWIRIYMNKTLDTTNDGKLKTLLGTDVQPADVKTLS
jgi:hypothetical protein